MKKTRSCFKHHRRFARFDRLQPKRRATQSRIRRSRPRRSVIRIRRSICARFCRARCRLRNRKQNSWATCWATKFAMSAQLDTLKKRR